MIESFTVHHDETYFQLRDCSTDKDLQQAITYIQEHPKVTSLSLGRFSNITDAGLIAAAPHLTNLTSLDLGWASEKITNAGLIAAAPHLTNLTSLDLRCSSNITDAGLIAAAPHLTNLTSLNLGSSSKITDAGLIAVASHFKNLISLYLGMNSKITDDGLIAAASHLKNLTSLDLGWGSNITADGFAVAAASLTNLTSLVLGGDSKITDVDKNRLVAINTKLVIDDNKDPVLDIDALPLTEKIGFILRSYLGTNFHKKFEGSEELGYSEEGKLAKDIAQYATTLKRNPYSLEHKAYLDGLKETLFDAFPNAMDALANAKGVHRIRNDDSNETNKTRVDDLMGDLLAAIVSEVSQDSSLRNSAAKSMASGYGVTVKEITPAAREKQL